MGDRGVGVTDQAPGTGVVDVRARERTIGGNTYEEQYVIPIPERVQSYKGMSTTFRTVGLATANHNIFSIFNTTGSAVIVGLRRISVQVEDTGVLLTVAPIIRSFKQTTAPTGTTSLSKVPFDSAQTSAANVEVKGATASDGGAATAITATAGTPIWSEFKMRAATAVGQYLFDDEPMIPRLCEDDPMYLRAAEGVLIQVVQASVTTAHYVVNCVWDEFTLP